MSADDTSLELSSIPFDEEFFNENLHNSGLGTATTTSTTTFAESLNGNSPYSLEPRSTDTTVSKSEIAAPETSHLSSNNIATIQDGSQEQPSNIGMPTLDVIEFLGDCFEICDEE